MKTSATNLLIETYIGAASYVVEVAGKEADNILDSDILRVYAVDGNLDVSIYGLGGISIDIVALANVYFDDVLTIQLYDIGDVLIAEQSYTWADVSGFDFKNIYWLVSADYVNRIRVFTTGGADSYLEKYIGFIWAGTVIDFGCIESVDPRSSSNDVINISRSNHPDVNPSYLYRKYSMTVKKDRDYKLLRADIESILIDGYGNGRPWILEEKPFDGEMIWGNLDSPDVKLDMFWSKDTGGNPTDYIAQTTIGVREIT